MIRFRVTRAIPHCIQVDLLYLQKSLNVRGSIGLTKASTVACLGGGVHKRYKLDPACLVITNNTSMPCKVK